MDVAAAVRHEVGGIDLELLRGRLEHHCPRLQCRLDHSVADTVRAARGEGAHAVRAGVAVGRVDVDILDRDAKRFGGNLTRHRLHALAKIDRGESDGELAVGIRMHERLGWIGAEIHPDRIVNRGEAAAAVTRHQCLLKPEREEKRIGPDRGGTPGAGGAPAGGCGGGRGGSVAGDGAGLGAVRAAIGMTGSSRRGAGTTRDGSRRSAARPCPEAVLRA